MTKLTSNQDINPIRSKFNNKRSTVEIYECEECHCEFGLPFATFSRLYCPLCQGSTFETTDKERKDPL